MSSVKRKETVDAKSMDKLARVLGTFDGNLNYLARTLNLVAYVEGVKIRLEGEQEQVEVGAKALNAMVKLASQGEEIDEKWLTAKVGVKSYKDINIRIG